MRSLARPRAGMTLITYRGRPVAMAGRERFALAPHVAERPDGDPLKRFVCFLVLYARDVLTGELPGEPRRYLPARAECYARECLLPAAAFRARAGRSDAQLARDFAVPPEQIAERRAELDAYGRGLARTRHGAPGRARASRRRSCGRE